MPDKGGEVRPRIETRAPLEQRFAAFGRAQQNIRQSLLQQPVSDIVRGDANYVSGMRDIVVAGVNTSDKIKHAIQNGVEAYVSQEKAINMWEQQWTREYTAAYQTEPHAEPLTDEALSRAKTAEILRLANRGEPLPLTEEQLSQITTERSHGGFSLIAPPEVLTQIGALSCDLPEGEVRDPSLVTEVISQTPQFGFALSKSETAALPDGPAGGMDLIFVSSTSTNIPEIISHEEGEVLGMHIEEGLQIRGYRADASRVLSDMASRFEHPGQEAMLGASGVTATYAKEHPREVAILSLLHKKAQERIDAAPADKKTQVRETIAQELRGAFLRPEQLLRVWYPDADRQQLLADETKRVDTADFQKQLYGEGLAAPILLSSRNARFMLPTPPRPPRKTWREKFKEWFARKPETPQDEFVGATTEINEFQQQVRDMQTRIAALGAIPTAADASQQALTLFEEVKTEWGMLATSGTGARVRQWKHYHMAHAMKDLQTHILPTDTTSDLLVSWATLVGNLQEIEDTYTPPPALPGPATSSPAHPIPRQNITVTRDQITAEVRDFIPLALHRTDSGDLLEVLKPVLDRGKVLSDTSPLEEGVSEGFRKDIMTNLAHRIDPLGGGILTFFKDNIHLAHEYLSALEQTNPLHNVGNAEAAVVKARAFIDAPAPAVYGGPSSNNTWQYRGARTIGRLVAQVDPSTSIPDTLFSTWEQQLHEVKSNVAIVPQDFLDELTVFMGVQRRGFLDTGVRFTAGANLLIQLMDPDFVAQLGPLRGQAQELIRAHLQEALRKGYPVEPYISLIATNEASVHAFQRFASESAGDAAMRAHISRIEEAVESLSLASSVPSARIGGIRTFKHIAATLSSAHVPLDLEHFQRWERLLADAAPVKGKGNGKVTRSDLEREATAFIRDSQDYLEQHRGDMDIVTLMAEFTNSSLFTGQVGERFREREFGVIAQTIRHGTDTMTPEIVRVLGTLIGRTGARQRPTAIREYLDAMQRIRHATQPELNIYQLQEVRDTLVGTVRAEFVAEARRRGYNLQP